MSDVDSSRAADAAKSVVRSIKAFAHGYESIEVLVRETTANNSELPSQQQLQAIAAQSTQYEVYPKLFAILWKRLTDLSFKRHVLKALIVLEYIMRTNPASPSVQLRLAVDVRQHWRDIYRLAQLRGGKSTSEIVHQIQALAEQLCNFICDFEAGKADASQDLLKSAEIPDCPSSSENTSPETSTNKQHQLGFDMMSDAHRNHDAWQCKACTFVNSAETTVCDICGKSRLSQAIDSEHLLATPDSGWTCDKCSFVNHQDNQQCEVCENQKPLNDDIEPQISSSSMATTPTRDTSASSHSSGESGTRFPVVRKADLLSRGGWACSWCAFLNKPTTMYCEVCDKERKSSQSANVVKLQYAKRRDDDRSWCCDVCTFVNAADAPECAICEHKRNEDPQHTMNIHHRAHTLSNNGVFHNVTSPSSATSSPVSSIRQSAFTADHRPTPIAIVAQPDSHKTVVSPAVASSRNQQNNITPGMPSSHAGARTPSYSGSPVSVGKHGSSLSESHSMLPPMLVTPPSPSSANMSPYPKQQSSPRGLGQAALLRNSSQQSPSNHRRSTSTPGHPVPSPAEKDAAAQQHNQSLTPSNRTTTTPGQHPASPHRRQSSTSRPAASFAPNIDVAAARASDGEVKQEVLSPGQQQWACPACSFHNSGLLLMCEICETPRPPPSHSSKATTAAIPTGSSSAISSATADTPSHQHTPPPLPLPRKPAASLVSALANASSSPASARSVTVSPSATTHHSSTPSTPPARSYTSAVPPPAQNQWVCSVCTYHNSLSTSTCVMCGLNRGGDSKQLNQHVEEIARKQQTQQRQQQPPLQQAQSVQAPPARPQLPTPVPPPYAISTTPPAVVAKAATSTPHPKQQISPQPPTSPSSQPSVNRQVSLDVDTDPADEVVHLATEEERASSDVDDELKSGAEMPPLHSQLSTAKVDAGSVAPPLPSTPPPDGQPRGTTAAVDAPHSQVYSPSSRTADAEHVLVPGNKLSLVSAKTEPPTARLKAMIAAEDAGAQPPASTDLLAPPVPKRDRPKKLSLTQTQALKMMADAGITSSHVQPEVKATDEHKNLDHLGAPAFPDQHAATVPAQGNTAHSEIVRKKVLEEILTSEQHYVDALVELITHYMEPMKRDANRINITTKQIAAIFSNISVLVQFHAIFLADLRRSNSMVQVFLQSADFLKMYTTYLNFYDKAIATMNSLRDNSKFQAFLNTHMEQLKGKSLMSYLIQPVQRIPRYVLLLRELKKHIPKTHPEYVALSTALVKIESIAAHVNESKRQIEQASRLIDIGQRLRNSGTFVVFSPTRRLLKEGILRKIKPEILRGNETILQLQQIGKQDNTTDEQLVFLFSDVLVITDSSFYMNHCLQLDTLIFQYEDDVDSDLQADGEVPPSSSSIAADDSNDAKGSDHKPSASAATVIISIGTKMRPNTTDLTFQCRTLAEREEWHRYIQSAIKHSQELNANHHRVMSNSLSSKGGGGHISHRSISLTNPYNSHFNPATLAVHSPSVSSQHSVDVGLGDRYDLD